MILPLENDKRVQEILKGDFTIRQKSYQIEAYYKSFITYNRTPGTNKDKPLMQVGQIEMELKKRGEDLTVIDITL